MGDGGHIAFQARPRIIDHIPYHAVGHRRVARAFHADRHRLAARVRRVRAAANPRETEIVAHHRNARLAETADDRLDVLQLLFLFRSIEQNIVPMRRVKILNGFEFKARGVDLFAKSDKFIQRPDAFGIARQSPALVRAGGLVVARIMRAAFEVIHEVRDDMGCAGLPRKLEIIARQHVTI